MRDMSTTVVTALLANTTLVTLLGGNRVYQLKAPNPEQWPRITFFELSNIDSQWSDDTATASEIHLQIDVWCQDPTILFPIANQIDLTMKSLGFKRTSSADLYEDDIHVYHKGMRYMTEITL